MTKKLAAFAAVAALVSIGAQAAEPDLIAVRRAGMALNAANFAGIRGVIAAKGDVKTLEAPAKAMARWIRIHPTLFPAGTDKGDTRALPTIWSDPAGFRKDAENLAVAAEKLAELAKAGDADGVAAAVKPIVDACNDCHKTYRQR